MSNRIFTEDQLRRKDIDTLKRFLRCRLGGYRVAIRDIRADNILYRGVPWRQRPTRVEQVSYPPPDKAKLGRANRAGSPMFYSSRAAPAVIYELRAKPGDRIALAEWQVAEPLWMHHLGYHRDALLRMTGSDVPRDPRLMNPIPGESSENAGLRRALALAFTYDVRDGEEHRYKQSVAINEVLFDKAGALPTPPGGPRSDRAAGTVYPALQLRGAADNVVLWPEFVERSLRIRSVRYVLVEAADEERSSYTILTEAISHTFSDRDIVWQEKLPSEIQRRSHIALEDGHWVLRDGFGGIYDFH